MNRNLCLTIILVLTVAGCGGMVENTKPMLVNRYDRMKLTNTTMFAIYNGKYAEARPYAEKVMQEQGYGVHLHDLPEYKMFVYGKDAKKIDPQYRAAKDSIRVVMRFFPKMNGTTRIELINSTEVRGLTGMVDKDMARIVSALAAGQR